MAMSRNAANSKTELPRGNSSHVKPVLSPIKMATMPMKHAEMPDVRGDDRNERQDKFSLAQARKNPEHHAERGGNRRSRKASASLAAGWHAAVSQQRAVGKHFRLVKSQRGEQSPAPGRRQATAPRRQKARATARGRKRQFLARLKFLFRSGSFKWIRFCRRVGRGCAGFFCARNQIGAGLRGILPVAFSRFASPFQSAGARCRAACQSSRHC